MSQTTPTPICRWDEHRDVKRITSDNLVFEKGDGRNVAVFSGTLETCICGWEQFYGRPIPWFEGTKEEWDKIKNEKGFPCSVV